MASPHLSYLSPPAVHQPSFHFTINDTGRSINFTLVNAFYTMAEKKKVCQAELVEADKVYEPTISISTKRV